MPIENSLPRIGITIIWRFNGGKIDADAHQVFFPHDFPTLFGR